MNTTYKADSSQQAKAEIFKQLHLREKLFILPNPWDAGSAKMLAALGFEALATTSAGFAFAQGKLDTIGGLNRDTAMSHAKDLVKATNLPVSADLENGFGDSPEAVQTTIFAAAEAGLVGCTIEDTTGVEDKPIYDKAFAIERIAAAVEAVRALDFPFMLTARAENYLHGRPDLADTLERLQGYESVGADVLYAPGLPDTESITTICQSVSKPVNVVAGIGLRGVSVSQLQACGVQRISTGSSLARTAIGSMLDAANAILDEGRFDAFESAASFKDIEALIVRGSASDD